VAGERIFVLQRRQLFRLGMGAAVSAGLCACPALGWAAALAGDEIRRVKLRNLHTEEALDAVYWEQGRYIPEVLGEVNRVLRDYRTGDIHPIDPNLIDLMGSIGAKVENRAPFQVISGYRSPHTSAAMRERSDGVARKSLHMEGMALDISLEDVDLAHLHRAALDVGRGGVGFYPKSNFVHVDVGPVRRWQGV
jgi:uncharacterized protein YcbK (DUF882 family)